MKTPDSSHAPLLIRTVSWTEQRLSSLRLQIAMSTKVKTIQLRPHSHPSAKHQNLVSTHVETTTVRRNLSSTASFIDSTYMERYSVGKPRISMYNFKFHEEIEMYAYETRWIEHVKIQRWGSSSWLLCFSVHRMKRMRKRNHELQFNLNLLCLERRAKCDMSADHTTYFTFASFMLASVLRKINKTNTIRLNVDLIESFN